MCTYSYIHHIQMAFESDMVGEKKPPGWKTGSRRRVYQRGRCSSPPSHSPAFPALASLLRRERGNFSIAEAVRQRTAEGRNKSATVCSLVTTRGKGIVQRERECQQGLGLQTNNVLPLYVPLHPAPACSLNLHSFNVIQSHPSNEPGRVHATLYLL